MYYTLGEYKKELFAHMPSDASVWTGTHLRSLNTAFDFNMACTTMMQEEIDPEIAAAIIGHMLRVIKRHPIPAVFGAPVFENGPTGHGDDCFSDADPAL